MKSQYLNPSLSLQSSPKPRQQPFGPFTFPHAPGWNTKSVQKSEKETTCDTQSNQELTSSHPLRIDQGAADPALPEVLRSSSHEHPTLPKSTSDGALRPRSPPRRQKPLEQAHVIHGAPRSYCHKAPNDVVLRAHPYPQIIVARASHVPPGRQ